MKKIQLLLFSILILISCEKKDSNDYNIKGSAFGIANGQKVFLEIKDNDNLKRIDTAVVENGIFKMNGKSTEPQIAFLTLENKNINYTFILEKGEIELKIDIENVTQSSVKGTFNNEKLFEYNLKANDIKNREAKFRKINSERLKSAKKYNDSTTVNLIMKEYKTYQDELNLLSKNFIENNKNAYLSLLLIDTLLDKNYASNEEIKSFFTNLNTSIKSTKLGKEIQQKINAIETTSIGQKAPEFSAPNTDKKNISLKEALGKYTLIQFWASWYEPCKEENKNIAAIYKKYHEKGLNIIGVSLDKDKTKWENAISEEALIWNQVSHLQLWDEPLVKLYNVKQIPNSFILDENGIIIARDLKGHNLEEKIDELFKN